MSFLFTAINEERKFEEESNDKAWKYGVVLEDYLGFNLNKMIEHKSDASQLEHNQTSDDVISATASEDGNDATDDDDTDDDDSNDAD